MICVLLFQIFSNKQQKLIVLTTATANPSDLHKSSANKLLEEIWKDLLVALACFVLLIIIKIIHCINMKLYQNGCRCKVKRKENITYLYFILEKLVQIQVKQ